MFWGHFSTDLGFKDKKLANIVWRLGGYPFPPIPLEDVHWEFMHTVRGQNSLGCVCKSHLVCLFTWRLPQPCISQHMTCTSIYLTLAKSDFLTVAIPFQLVQKWVQHKTFSQKKFSDWGGPPPFTDGFPVHWELIQWMRVAHCIELIR